MSARNVPKKHSHGDHTVNPVVEVVISGHKQDRAHAKSKAVKGNGLLPTFNFKHRFQIKRPEMAVLTFNIYDTHKATTTTKKVINKRNVAMAAAAGTAAAVIGTAAVATGVGIPFVLAAAAVGGAIAGGGAVFTPNSTAVRLASVSISVPCIRSGVRVLPLIDYHGRMRPMSDLVCRFTLERSEKYDD